MLITVFTPTYNRANTLPRLFNSLNSQTSFDFEWIIVDDGSTDNTDDVLNDLYRQPRQFAMKIARQTNGGKHRAINQGVKIACGKLFFIVDSDDWLEPNAVEVVTKYYHSIENLHGYAGIVGLRQSNKGKEPFCFDIEYFDATALERIQFGAMGENAEVFYTDILRQYPFPEFDNENFISEGIVWSKIASDGYKMRWINEVIYNYEYRPDGLTYNLREKYKMNPRGYLTYIEQENRLHNRSWLRRMSQFGRCLMTVDRKNISGTTIRELLRINFLEYMIAPIVYYFKKKLNYTSSK